MSAVMAWENRNPSIKIGSEVQVDPHVGLIPEEG